MGFATAQACISWGSGSRVLKAAFVWGWALEPFAWAAVEALWLWGLSGAL